MNTDSTGPSDLHCVASVSRREIATLLRSIDQLPPSQVRRDAEIVVLDVVRRRETAIGRGDLITLLYLLDQVPACEARLDAEAIVLDGLMRVREADCAALATEAAE